MMILSPPSKGRRCLHAVNPSKERVRPTAPLTGNEDACEKRCSGHLISLLGTSLDGRLAGHLRSGVSSDKRVGKRWLGSGEVWQMQTHAGRWHVCHPQSHPCCDTAALQCQPGRAELGFQRFPFLRISGEGWPREASAEALEDGGGAVTMTILRRSR